jgi:hypothetical protein
MIDFVLAAVVLAVIVGVSLKVGSLVRKLAVFLALGGATAAYLWLAEGEFGLGILHDVFAVDYVQFVGIPLVTVMIASLRLFGQRLPANLRIGWFLWLVIPLVGNVATTWAVTPVTLSLIPHLKREYPERWVLITIAVFTFSANFLAMATLLADPPQSYWAIKAAAAGEPLGFFFPFVHFWPYLLFTWVLYGFVLRHLGARFGTPWATLRFVPAHWGKFLLGLSFAAAIGLALMLATGYGVAAILGVAFLAGLILGRFAFGKQEWHDTKHWTTETAATFVAFFSVVALAHAGMHHVTLPDEGMIAAVILMTLGADNAAAFAAGYQQFLGHPQDAMVWYNLFNAIAYGGLSPLGNGPQITLFLIILVGMRHLSTKTVFGEWMRLALVLGPYLLVWTVGAHAFVSAGEAVSWPRQFAIGVGALTVALIWMRQSSAYLPYLDSVRHHTRPSRRTAQTGPEV